MENLGYDIITWVILGAAVLYYFVVPVITDVKKVFEKKADEDKKDETA